MVKHMPFEPLDSLIRGFDILLTLTQMHTTERH